MTEPTSPASSLQAECNPLRGRVMLHVCCGPCALWPARALRAQGWQVSGLWFNPNIHPALEYSKRLEACRRLFDLEGMCLEVADQYGLDEFLGRVWPQQADSGARCRTCYTWRLAETARRAREADFPGFTTSLLVSPYQQHELLMSVGEEIARSAGAPQFVYEDWRPYYREGRVQSKALGLYHQQYCGCMFSEAERYGRRQRRSGAGA